MYDFSNFTMVEAVKCGREIRNLGSTAKSMEEAAEEIVRFFHKSFVETATGARSCVLVRLFKTHDYDDLESDLAMFARDMLKEGHPEKPFKCFTLLATCGDKEEWMSRRNSRGHQAIPLPSSHVVEQIPMMRNMIKQMGLEINGVINPDPKVIMDLSQKTFNVFHIPDAVESPHIPAQEGFVKPSGVKSVLGFGGVLPSGNVFVVIIFSRTPIDKESAARFVTMALNVKMVLLPYEHRVFAMEGTHHGRNDK